MRPFSTIVSINTKYETENIFRLQSEIPSDSQHRSDNEWQHFLKITDSLDGIREIGRGRQGQKHLLDMKTFILKASVSWWFAASALGPCTFLLFPFFISKSWSLWLDGRRKEQLLEKSERGRVYEKQTLDFDTTMDQNGGTGGLPLGATKWLDPVLIIY